MAVHYFQTNTILMVQGVGRSCVNYYRILCSSPGVVIVLIGEAFRVCHECYSQILGARGFVFLSFWTDVICYILCIYKAPFLQKTCLYVGVHPGIALRATLVATTYVAASAGTD